MGKSYRDSIVCDVVEMSTSHFLLGRPWQYDVDATHRGKENIYVFSWKGKMIALHSISSQAKNSKGGFARDLGGDKSKF